MDGPARLSLSTLREAKPEVIRPRIDPRALSHGIVHLGLGVFHRAHQALITEEAMAVSGDRTWAITGVTQRSDRVVRQLRPQDCLYTVLEKSPERIVPRIVGSIREALFPADGLPDVLAAIADSGTRIISLTITEKGYRAGPDRRLLIDEQVRADADALRAELRGAAHAPAPSTAVGLLARGLARRARAGMPPVAVMSCDNMVKNGETLAGILTDFIDLVDHPRATEALHGVSFVSTVVDRMVPTTGQAALEEVTQRVGLRDEGAALAEPFWQWVAQDAFPSGRPAWDLVGVTFADDVTPYELLKLRLLNAAHSLLSYLGSLAGFRTIAETVAVPEFRDAAWSLMVEDSAPGLDLPDEVDAIQYSAVVMERYRNSALGHQTAQVAMDGSQKLPLRLPPIAEAALDRGHEPRATALAYAAWMVFLARGATVDGRPLRIDDPRADELCAAARGGEATLVERFLRLPGVFSDRLVAEPTWRELLEDAVARFRSATPADWARLE